VKAASPPVGSAVRSDPVRGPRGADGRLRGVGSRYRFAGPGSGLRLKGCRRMTVWYSWYYFVKVSDFGVLYLKCAKAGGDLKLQR